jgi:5-(carboxyamino)imidazole ribonucleotide mutase
MAKFRHGYSLEETLFGDAGAFNPTTAIRVGVIMGSRSDWPTVEPCCTKLNELEIGFEYGVVSAHRTPDRMRKYAHNAEKRGIQIIIACAGGSSHLQGMTASETILPVLGFGPMSSKFGPMDVIGSCVRMPAGAPLSFLGFDEAGAVNAALEAAKILSLFHPNLKKRLKKYLEQQCENVPYSAHD